MSPAAFRWALSVVAVLALGGVGLIDNEFDVQNPWFYIGLTLVIVCTISANAVMREARTRTLNDEFDAGYRAGYRAGRRASLTVARPTIQSTPTPLRSRRTKATWPDTGNSHPGSTKLQ